MTLQEFKEEMLNEKDYKYVKEILRVDSKINELEDTDVFYDETPEFEELYCEKKFLFRQLLENHPELEADGMEFAYSIIHEMKSGKLTFNAITNKWELKQ